MLPDQKDLWDKKHSEGLHESFRDAASTLANLIVPYLRPRSNILDLGCGVGRDSVFFAARGHNVIATDLSPVVIAQNKRHFAGHAVEFTTFDMQKPLPYPDEKFDLVFSNLSLHYYIDQVTRSGRPFCICL
jgi:SAM-dependent methyltransferase